MSWREAHARRVAELEAAAVRVLLGALDPILTSAAQRFAALTADGADAQAQGSPDDIAGISAQWQAAVHDQVLPWFAGVYDAGAAAAGEQILGLGIVVPDPLPEHLDQAAAAYLRQAEPRFFGLGDEAWQAAHAAIVTGFEEGEGIADIRRRIQAVTDLTRRQADALARTEVISASNMGAQAYVDALGADAPPYKQWLATMDGRTRPTHLGADGQVVRHGERFEVGAAHLVVPGDPTGPAAEVINCRCTTLYLDSAEPIPVDTVGRGQGGPTPIVDEVAAEVAAAGRLALAGLPDTAENRAKLVAAAASLKEIGRNDAQLEVAPPSYTVGPPQVDTTTGEPHTGAMVALLPTAEDAERLALPGGEPAEALHLTLRYLGDGDAIPDEAFADMLAEAEMIAAQLGPIDAQVFGAAVWNTSGDETSMVLSVGDRPDNEGRQLVEAHLAGMNLESVGMGYDWRPPTNHSPWVAHVCLAYGDVGLLNPVVAAADREGPIRFDRLRVARGGDAFDFELAAPEPAEEDEDVNAADLAKLAAAGGTLTLPDGRQARLVVQPSGAAAIPPVTLRVPRGVALALTAAAGDGPPAQPGEHLRAIMHVRGTTTGDGDTGRLFLNTDYRDPPFSFNYQLRSSAHGGLPEVVHIGNVVRVVEDGPTLYGFVTLDLDGEHGAEYARRSVAGIERWVSMGLDETKPAKVTVQWEPDPNPDEMPEDGEPVEMLGVVLETIDGGRIGELTAVSVPAQADAVVEPTAELLALYGVAEDPVDPEPAPEDEEPEVEPVAASAAGRGYPSSTRPASDLAPPPRGPAPGAVAASCGGSCGGTCGGCGHNVTPADAVQAVTAAAWTITVRELPPADWYTEPQAAEMAGALMVNEHGRVWGLLAPMGTGHRAYVRSGRRLEAPSTNVDYDRFMGAWGLTAAGRVPAGPLTMDCGHAPRVRADHQVGPDHYDNACSVFATVAAGYSHRLGGAWIAGALVPSITPDHVARALACRCSGDWQPHPDRPGWSELIAALLVPSPGFGSAHPEGASATWQDGALVASSVPVRYAPTERPRATPLASAVRLFADHAGRTPSRRVLDATGPR